MPILKKVFIVGGKSRGITLPKSWLELYEKELGYEIREVVVEVNGELKIRPFIVKSEKKNE